MDPPFAPRIAAEKGMREGGGGRDGASSWLGGRGAPKSLTSLGRSLIGLEGREALEGKKKEKLNAPVHGSVRGAKKWGRRKNLHFLLSFAPAEGHRGGGGGKNIGVLILAREGGEARSASNLTCEN